jgi:hypothetical protein
MTELQAQHERVVNGLKVGLRFVFIAGGSALASVLLMGASSSSRQSTSSQDAVRGGSTLQEETNAGPGDSDTIHLKDVSGQKATSSTSSATSAQAPSTQPKTTTSGTSGEPAGEATTTTTTTTTTTESSAEAAPSPTPAHKKHHGKARHHKKKKKASGAAVEAREKESHTQAAERHEAAERGEVSGAEQSRTESIQTEPTTSSQAEPMTSAEEEQSATAQAEQERAERLREAREAREARQTERMHRAHAAKAEAERSASEAQAQASAPLDLHRAEPSVFYEPSSRQPAFVGSTAITGKDKSLASLERNDTPFVDAAARVRAAASRNSTEPLSQVNFNDYTYSHRGQFESDMNSRLDKISSELDVLRAKVKASGQIARADALRDIDKLESDRAKVAGALDRVNQVADDRWSDFKSDFRSQISSLESSYQSLNASIR